MLNELSLRMEKAVCESLRRSDAVTRYGKGQFLALLLDTKPEECDMIQKRINSRFIIGHQRSGIEYHVSVVFQPE